MCWYRLIYSRHSSKKSCSLLFHSSILFSCGMPDGAGSVYDVTFIEYSLHVPSSNLTKLHVGMPEHSVQQLICKIKQQCSSSMVFVSTANIWYPVSYEILCVVHKTYYCILWFKQQQQPRFWRFGHLLKLCLWMTDHSSKKGHNLKEYSEFFFDIGIKY